MKNSKYTKEILEPIVKASNSFSDVVRQLTDSEKVHGGMVDHIKKQMIKNSIDFSHFNKQYFKTGYVIINGPNKMTLERLNEDYLTKNPKKKTSNFNIKKWLFNFKLKIEICEICSLTNKWMDKSLSLQLDHIDGDNSNYEINNLRILCPNCHSQTDNYAGKKNKKIMEG
jgi:hypothetical protein